MHVSGLCKTDLFFPDSIPQNNRHSGQYLMGPSLQHPDHPYSVLLVLWFS